MLNIKTWGVYGLIFLEFSSLFYLKNHTPKMSSISAVEIVKPVTADLGAVTRMPKTKCLHIHVLCIMSIHKTLQTEWRPE